MPFCIFLKFTNPSSFEHFTKDFALTYICEKIYLDLQNCLISMYNIEHFFSANISISNRQTMYILQQKWICRQTNIREGRQLYRQTGRHAGRQAYRQADGV
jgi:hypothetical protein